MIMAISISLLKETYLEFRTESMIVLILLLAIVLTRVSRWLLDKFVNASSEKLRVDPTKYKFFKNAVSFIIWLVALTLIIYTIPKLKTLAVTLFAGAGILFAILGFAAQQAFSNIISGIFIVIFKPFRVGDVIKVGASYMGAVEDITLRHTVILDFENRRIIIPNSVVSSETVINSTIEDSKICEFVELGISYDSNVDKAIEIIQEEALKHPFFIDNRTGAEKAQSKPPVVVKVIGFGDFSVNLRAWIWADDFNKAREIHFDLNKSIKEGFDKGGIEIPFPYRTLVYKKDLESKPKVEDGE